MILKNYNFFSGCDFEESLGVMFYYAVKKLQIKIRSFTVTYQAVGVMNEIVPEKLIRC
jgi:hypothetical protein